MPLALHPRLHGTALVHDKTAAEARRDSLKEQGVAPVMLILDKGRDGMVRGKWGAEFHFRTSTFYEFGPGTQGLIYTPPPPVDDPPPNGHCHAATTNGCAAPAGAHLPLPPPGHGTRKPKKGGTAKAAAGKGGKAQANKKAK